MGLFVLINPFGNFGLKFYSVQTIENSIKADMFCIAHPIWRFRLEISQIFENSNEGIMVWYSLIHLTILARNYNVISLD